MQKKLTNEDVDKRLLLNNRKIIRVGDIIKARIKNEWKCLICNNIWMAAPTNILHSVHPTNCPKCYGNNKLSEEEIDRKILERKIPIIRISKIINCSSLAKWRCLKCLREWETSPNKILNFNRGCLKCNKSMGEGKIITFLENMRLDYKYQKSFIDFKNPLTNKYLYFDFFIPSKNLCIEYDGTFHYDPDFLKSIGIKFHNYHTKKNFEYNSFKDILKNNYCKKSKIELLRIPFWECRNIENIIKTKLDQISICPNLCKEVSG